MRWQRIPGLYLEHELTQLISHDPGRDWHFTRHGQNYEVYSAAHEDTDAAWKLLREAILVLDAVARTPIVLCFCGEGHRKCDCGGDAVRMVLRDARGAGIEPLGIKVAVP